MGRIKRFVKFNEAGGYDDHMLGFQDEGEKALRLKAAMEHVNAAIEELETVSNAEQMMNPDKSKDYLTMAIELQGIQNMLMDEVNHHNVKKHLN